MPHSCAERVSRRRKTPEYSERLLVYAPVGRDGELLTALACGNGFLAESVDQLDQLPDYLRAGVGAVILTEEALHQGRDLALAQWVDEQPEWSDLPFIVLASRAGAEERAIRTVALAKPLRNVTIVERPVRPSTLLSALDVVLRDRRRQYELRDLLGSYRTLSKELEKRVADRTVELLDANREMEGFTYSVSHDLRGPLRAINSTSMILKEDYGYLLPPEALLQLDRQAAASKKLASLIDDLLRLSRLARQELKWTTIDLSSLVSDVVAEVAAHTNTPCVFEIQPGVLARGDATLLRLAILNLIENAVKFSPNGGTIRFGLEPGESNSYFISDEGIGIDPQYAHKVFQPFERLVTDQQFPGTGIGLANVHRIIARHNGRIWTEPGSDAGTTFRFTLAER